MTRTVDESKIIFFSTVALIVSRLPSMLARPIYSSVKSWLRGGKGGGRRRERALGTTLTLLGAFELQCACMLTVNIWGLHLIYN